MLPDSSLSKKLQRLKTSWISLVNRQGWWLREYSGGPIGEIVAKILEVNVTACIDDKTSTPSTRIKAVPITNPPLLSLSIREEGIVSSVSKMIGHQDISIGDPVFDAQFQIQSDNPELCRLWLDLRNLDLIQHLMPYKLSLLNGTVSLVKDGVEEDTERLCEVMQDAAGLASTLVMLEQRWSDLAARINANRTDHQPFRGIQLPALTLIHSGVLVTLSLALHRKGVLELITSTESNHVIELALWPSESEDDHRFYGYRLQGDEETADKLIHGDILAALLRVRPSSLQLSPQRFAFTFLGAIPARIEDALDLLVALSSPSHGPYR
jgi:hypothetical protein